MRSEDIGERPETENTVEEIRQHQITWKEGAEKMTIERLLWQHTFVILLEDVT
jgi:hypothetical protein